MVKEINHHYSMEASATIFDEEAMTSLQLSGRTAGKVNELVRAFNQLDEETASRLLAQDERIPVEVREQVQRHIDNGEFAQAINLYAGNLQAQVDNLLSNVSAGSVSTALDAELVDIRVSKGGRSYESAGKAVRAIAESLLNFITNSGSGSDITNGLIWMPFCSLSTRGQLVELDTSVPSNERWCVACLPAERGTRVYGEVNVTSNSCALAVGTIMRPVSGVVLGEGEDFMTRIDYTVKDEVEYLWFMHNMQSKGKVSLHIVTPTAMNAVKEGQKTWTMGYIGSDGSLVIDEPAKLHAMHGMVEVPPYHVLTADLQASPAVSTITEFIDPVNFVVGQILATGKDGNTRQEYKYVNATTSTKYVALSTRVNAQWDDESVDKTFINDINLQVKPYTDKYRVPEFTVGNGHINVAESNVKNDSVYMYSDMIKLYDGETIRFPSAGTSGAWLLSEWNPVERTFVRGLVKGDSMFRWVEYTNTSRQVMYVRACAKKVPSSANDNAVTEAEFRDVRIYAKPVYYADVMNHPLYGKKLALFGDSLFAGNNSGVDSTWWATLAHKYNMTTEFFGGNGYTLTNGSKGDSGSIADQMSRQYTGDADYCVVIGGANDLRVGETVADFKNAVRECITMLRTSGKSKILFMTNMNRFGSTNSIGVNEKDYADAMLEVCDELCVPCFDNYRKLGVYFRDPNMAEWCDEGRVKAFAFDGNTDASTFSAHLSRAGYEWVLPVYENLLVKL